MSDCENGAKGEGGNPKASRRNDKDKAKEAKPIWVPVTVAEKVIGLGHTKVYELINNGSLESVKVGRRRLISYASLLRLGTGAS